MFNQFRSITVTIATVVGFTVPHVRPAVRPITPGQQRSARSILHDAPAMVKFFTGAWHCGGNFANGRPAGGDIVFAGAAGGAWLSQAQDDTPPGAYHATSLWGMADSVSFSVYIADSGGGMRHFTGSNDWPGGRIQLSREATSNAKLAERFRYVRQSIDSFSLIYETTQDSARTWQMGDSVLCARKR